MMPAQARTEQLIAHLINEARRNYDANQFTIRLMPDRDRIGIRFRVKEDTPARRPTAPPPEIRPAEWDKNVAEVISDMEDELHMTWSWPEEQPDRDAMAAFAKKLAAETGLTILLN